MADDIHVQVEADASGLKSELAELDRLAQGVGRALSNAFVGAAVKGKSFGDVLRTLGAQLADMALRAALAPLTQGIGSLVQGLAGGLSGALGFARGGVVAQGRVRPFAAGGVVAAPTYFPLSGGDLGLMGERGAEAILPLARGPDGRLGVAGGGGSVTVNVSIATPDVESFRRSETQVAAALARAVARGRRGV